MSKKQRIKDLEKQVAQLWEFVHLSPADQERERAIRERAQQMIDKEREMLLQGLPRVGVMFSDPNGKVTWGNQ